MKALIYLCIALSISTIGAAQSLPKIQSGSILAPSDIKVDGQLKEWGNKLQAYNYAGRVFYTISNNAENIYLTVRAPGPFAIEKILYGGITFSVSPAGNEKGAVAITFPTVPGKEIPTLINAAHYYHHQLKKDTNSNRLQIDTLTASVNDRLKLISKEIQVKGFDDIEDGSISIYNTAGIKAAIGFSHAGSLICEFALPLKIIHLLTATPDEIYYNVKLNGIHLIQSPEDGQRVQGKANSGDIAVLTPVSPNEIDHDAEYVEVPTDFGGKYNIVRKK
jgi:hypothetical protein